MSARKLWILLGTACAAGLLLFFLRGRADYANLPPVATGPWVAFGDSLTAGFGASEGSNYPVVLGRRLGVTIANFGKGGETTADGLNRVEEVAKLAPRVVLLCFGGNDSLNQES